VDGSPGQAGEVRRDAGDEGVVCRRGECGVQERAVWGVDEEGVGHRRRGCGVQETRVWGLGDKVVGGRRSRCNVQ
jgi:hypothetical protein